MSDNEYASSVSVSDSHRNVEFKDSQVAVGYDEHMRNNNVDNMSDTQLLAGLNAFKTKECG